MELLILPTTPLSFAVHQYPAEHNSTPQSSPLPMCTSRPRCLTTCCQIWSEKTSIPHETSLVEVTKHSTFTRAILTCTEMSKPAARVCNCCTAQSAQKVSLGLDPIAKRIFANLFSPTSNPPNAPCILHLTAFGSLCVYVCVCPPFRTPAAFSLSPGRPAQFLSLL